MYKATLLTMMLTTWSARSFAPRTFVSHQRIYQQQARLLTNRVQLRGWLTSGMTKLFGFATQEELEQVISDPSLVYVDVRNDKEIQEAPFSKPFVHAQGTPFACPILEEQSEKLLPDKNAPVIVFCASGKRAAKAKEVLESKGYAKVLNAGGIGLLNENLSMIGV